MELSKTQQEIIDLMRDGWQLGLYIPGLQGSKGGTMYTETNYQTKKALKEAVEAGFRVAYFQPGPFGGNEPTEGTITLEGPHFPAAHKWYAQAQVKGGVVVKVK